MKNLVELVKLSGEKNGYIGTIVDFRWGQVNLLNHCYKSSDEITVIDGESQGENTFTLEEFAKVYKNRQLQILQ